jgi:hypothetical protein
VLTRRFFIYTRGQRSLSPAADAFVAFLSWKNTSAQACRVECR